MAHEFVPSAGVYEWSDEYVCKHCLLSLSFAAEDCVSLKKLNEEYKDSYCPVKDKKEEDENPS